MAARVVILGAGQAGAQVAISLRQLGFAGDIVLLGDEPHPPYQRPPLSKGLLTGEMDVERTYIRQLAWYEKHAIELRLNARAERIERECQRLVLTGGEELAYNYLVLCTGTRARRLRLPGEQLQGVFYLRTLDESHAIRAAARPGTKAVIVGGGYIGLEVAAGLIKLGCEVTVLEALPRVMSRVVPASVSDFFTAEHEGRGARILTGTGVVSLQGGATVEQVLCANRATHDADLALIGVGAAPNDDIARDAGLATENGVVVDELGRTIDPHIFAAGDVTNHPSHLFARRIRLESVHNAQAQAKAVASAIAGRPAPYRDVPWFWSDQYDLKLQIAGIASPDDEHVIRGDPATRAFSCLHLRDGRLVAIDAINRAQDFLGGQKLIAAATPVDRTRAADLDVRLSDL
jgi:3-phenylpropionate/trans-cinnamate dioxygenase ferredoxin reductase component